MTGRNTPTRRLPAAAALCIALFAGWLAGCGPGEGGTGALAGGVQIGRVDGFGSTFIDGAAYDDREARVRLDENPLATVDVPLTELELGVVTSARLEAGRIVEGTVAAPVIGPIDSGSVSLDGNEFSILGQRVSVAGRGPIQPVFDGVRAGEFTAGLGVEVHGLRLSNGTLVATRVERRSTQAAAIRINGTLTQVDPVEQVLTLGATRVRFDRAAVTPDRLALVPGRTVTIYTTLPPNRSGEVEARSVRVDSIDLVAGTELRISGFVHARAADGNFTVQGIAVEAGRAGLSGVATLADLQIDEFVRVTGVFDGRVLQARDITVLRRVVDAPLVLRGRVSDFSSPINAFRLRGATARLATDAALAGGTLDNLATGVEVEARGRLVDGEVVVSRLEWLAPDAVMVGTIAGYDPAAGTLSMPPLARPARLAPQLAVRNGVAADIANGRRVRLYGRVEGDTFVAAELQFLDNPASPVGTLLVGIPSAASPMEQQFRINGNVVRITPQTRFTGGPSGSPEDLARGYVTIVRAERIGGSDLVATHVESRFAFDRRENVVGFVSEFAGLDRVRVGGQRSDLTGVTDATFLGRRAGLRDGAFVLAQGTLQGGTMLAWKLVVLEE